MIGKKKRNEEDKFKKKKTYLISQVLFPIV